MAYYSSTTHLVIIIAYWVFQTPLIIGDKASSPQVIAPHCSEKCGNISIPYPFGIEDGCYFKDPTNSFRIFCNQTSTVKQRPFISLNDYDNLELLNISPAESELRCNVYASYDCYNQTGGLVEQWWAGFYLESFTVSSTKNTLVGIGCDSYAWIDGFRDGKGYNTGCVTQCSDAEDAGVGECTGIGCCEGPIVKGLKNVTYNSNSFHNHTSVYQFNPCSVAFPVAKDGFRFYRTNLSLNVAVLNRGVKVPVVFNWVIGQKNCSMAKGDGSYLCKQNTDCYDPEFELGYRCKCSNGFYGNPYLPQGCSDIDECNEENNCEKTEFCMNTIGGYICKCPDGYHGNGTNVDPCKANSKAKPTVAWVSIGLGVSLGSILLAFFGWWLYLAIKRAQVKKQRSKYYERNGGLLLQQQMSFDDGLGERIKLFTIDELEKATDYFNKNRILGEGGHGTVYKGMLGEGRIVAVKKSHKVEESQVIQFINEVVILSKINHRNIVKLLGCCLETNVPILVYEFILNGTVFHHIHNPSEEFPITWKMRLQIASDSAAALAYLHSSSSTLIFHRDIKSSNILLDDKYRAKLSDFGTSRSVTIDQTHVVTNVMGTFGYMDPEYFQTHQYTEKSDVYSFGVVLVELLTGEKAIRATSEEDKSLISWFLYHMENTCLLDIVDSQVLLEGSKEEIMVIANLAMHCLMLDRKGRPTMKEVLLEIESVLSLHVPQANDTKKPKYEQLFAFGTTKSSVQYFNTFCSESGGVTSAEQSLLFNPR